MFMLAKMTQFISLNYVDGVDVRNKTVFLPERRKA